MYELCIIPDNRTCQNLVVLETLPRYLWLRLLPRGSLAHLRFATVRLEAHGKSSEKTLLGRTLLVASLNYRRWFDLHYVEVLQHLPCTVATHCLSSGTCLHRCCLSPAHLAAAGLQQNATWKKETSALERSTQNQMKPSKRLMWSTLTSCPQPHNSFLLLSQGYFSLLLSFLFILLNTKSLKYLEPFQRTTVEIRST